MRFKIKGALRDTASDVILIVDAESIDEARQKAFARKVLINSVEHYTIRPVGFMSAFQRFFAGKTLRKA